MASNSELSECDSPEISRNVTRISQRMGQAPDWDHLPSAELCSQKTPGHLGQRVQTCCQSWSYRVISHVISCHTISRDFSDATSDAKIPMRSALGREVFSAPHPLQILQLAPVRGSRPKVTTASRLPRWNFTSWGKSVQLAGTEDTEERQNWQVQIDPKKMNE